jgi:AcrR family transcriptional regulator
VVAPRPEAQASSTPRPEAQASSTPRTDTRSRAQTVALQLFAEQGYEKTSLREIAERLGVTKAALYYHFRSKEDIVHSFTDDHFAAIDALIDWARDRPRGPQTRREILERYVGIVLDNREVFRFIEQNRAAMQSMEAGKSDRIARFRSRLDTLVELLAGPDAPLRDRVRATAALFAANTSCMYLSSAANDLTDLRAIVLEIATDLTTS